MHSHRLLQLDDNKSAASCQQTWCKLIVTTFYPQGWCKLFRQLATSLQISSCIDLMHLAETNRFDATWWQTCIKFVGISSCESDPSCQIINSLTCQQSPDFSTVSWENSFFPSLSPTKREMSFLLISPSSSALKFFTAFIALETQKSLFPISRHERSHW